MATVKAQIDQEGSTTGGGLWSEVVITTSKWISRDDYQQEGERERERMLGMRGRRSLFNSFCLNLAKPKSRSELNYSTLVEFNLKLSKVFTKKEKSRDLKELGSGFLRLNHNTLLLRWVNHCERLGLRMITGGGSRRSWR
ncbi:hypothetical protein BY996DRAFT_8400061 [Phakopsora pachyrhizi]|nr:hypothetical protein BY996DRAFT_8400061 [Phakopsora pachyrhizi]